MAQAISTANFLPSHVSGCIYNLKTMQPWYLVYLVLCELSKAAIWTGDSGTAIFGTSTLCSATYRIVQVACMHQRLCQQKHEHSRLVQALSVMQTQLIGTLRRSDVLPECATGISVPSNCHGKTLLLLIFHLSVFLALFGLPHSLKLDDCLRECMFYDQCQRA